MPRITAEFAGPQIYFKRDDLTGSSLSGNKIRKLEFSMAEALAQKAKVIITAGGIQSNHCRATALVCAKLGLECHLILRGAPDGPPDGNLLLDYLAGARVSFYPPEVYNPSKQDIAAKLAKEYAAEGKHAYWIPVGASNAIGAWGYVREYEEILAQQKKLGIKFNHIVATVGSGGTNCGLIAGRALTAAKKPHVWGINICDDEQTFLQDITAALEDMRSKFNLKMKSSDTPVHILDGYVGQGYGISYPEAVEMIKLCARLEGQVLDPVYTGKAMYGLRQEIKAGRFKKEEKVLFIHTGGIFGLFPQRELFQH